MQNDPPILTTGHNSRNHTSSALKMRLSSLSPLGIDHKLEELIKETKIDLDCGGPSKHKPREFLPHLHSWRFPCFPA